MTTSAFAYTDESGNTGLNIFDRAQPTFFTLTIVSAADLSIPATNAVGLWCKTLGVEELHAADLGVGRLSTIAPEAARFIESNGLRFIITVVEKKHMAAMKFADTILDAGVNPAVHALHYWARPLRLMNALHLASHMRPRDERQFWEAYARQDYRLFCEVASRVESSIAVTMLDARARELLQDALKWAMANPKALLERRRTLDAPNIVAFSFVISALHALYKSLGIQVRAFVHDEQNEFMKSFRMMYTALTPFRFEDKTSILVPGWEEAEAFDCPLTEASSKSTPALQIVDILLWLAKRHRENGSTGSPECDYLVETVIANGTVEEFSRLQLIETVQQLTTHVNSLPLSRHKLREGLALQQRFERQRKRAMR